MGKKYYVEFYSKENKDQNYFMQSNFFNTHKDAEKWFKEFIKNISYIDSSVVVCLMSADWNDEDDNYEDIAFVKKLEKDNL